MGATPEFSFLVLGLSLLLYKIVNLAKNIRHAKRTGLPYTVVPVLETEVLGKLLTPVLRKVFRNRFVKNEGWPRWCRFTMLDWAWEEKRRAHNEFGEVFLVVSPEGIICYSADADMSWDVMHRRNEFIKPRDKYSEESPDSVSTMTDTDQQKCSSHMGLTWSQQRAKNTIFMCESQLPHSTMVVEPMILCGRKACSKPAS